MCFFSGSPLPSLWSLLSRIKTLTFSWVSTITEEIAFSWINYLVSFMAFPSTYSTATITSSQIAWITIVPMLLLIVLLSLRESTNFFRSFHKPHVFLVFHTFLLSKSIYRVIFFLLLFEHIYIFIFIRCFLFLALQLLLYCLNLILLNLLPYFLYLLGIIFQLVSFDFWEFGLPKLAQEI